VERRPGERAVRAGGACDTAPVPDTEGRWGEWERPLWRPDQPCPNCGSQDIHPQWLDATTPHDEEGTHWFMPGRRRCHGCWEIV
jgi:hypothetical protein